jgi:small subunit ribosomal protein S16
MVKIRLSRAGCKGRPFYHVVVSTDRTARDSNNIEKLGFFNPVALGKEVSLELNMDRVAYWLGVGAKPTEKVSSLIKRTRQANLAAAA